VSYRNLLGPFGSVHGGDGSLWWVFWKLEFLINELPFDLWKELVLFTLSFRVGIDECFSVSLLLIVFDLLVQLLLALPHAVVHLS